MSYHRSGAHNKYRTKIFEVDRLQQNEKDSQQIENGEYLKKHSCPYAILVIVAVEMNDSNQRQQWDKAEQYLLADG